MLFECNWISDTYYSGREDESIVLSIVIDNKKGELQLCYRK